MDKQRHRNATLKFFKDAAIEKQGFYDSKDPSQLKHSIWQKRVRLYLQKKIANRAKKNASIADVGCGNGDFTKFLAEKYPECTFSGYDFSAEMIDLARSQEISPNLSFDILELGADPVLDKTFDIVMCINMFHHVYPDDWEKSIHTLTRMTNSTILLEIKNADNLWNRRFRRASSDFPLTLISIAQVKSLFEKRFFSIKNIWSIFGIQKLSPILIIELSRQNNQTF